MRYVPLVRIADKKRIEYFGLRARSWGKGLNCLSTGTNASSCEHDNRPSNFITGEEFPSRSATIKF